MRAAAAAVALAVALALPAALAALPSVHFPNERPRQHNSPLTAENVNVAEFGALKAKLEADGSFFHCTGHASEAGTDDFNSKLSRRRCAFVIHHLAAAGLPARAVPSVGAAPAGCVSEGAITACGESKTKGKDAAAARRADFSAIRAEGPELPPEPWATCASFRQSGQCQELSASEADGAAPCANLVECASKCCSFGTCGKWSDAGGSCAPKYSLGFVAGGLSNPLPYRTSTQCGSHEDCSRKCCEITPPTERERGPSISAYRPRVCRDGKEERPLSCYYICAHNKRAIGINGILGFRSEANVRARDQCGLSCGQRKLRSCPEDSGTWFHRRVTAATCKDICRD